MVARTKELIPAQAPLEREASIKGRIARVGITLLQESRVTQIEEKQGKFLGKYFSKTRRS